MKGFTEESLKGMSVVPDGNGGFRAMTKEERGAYGVCADVMQKELSSTTPKIIVEPEIRSVTINLFGVPMPKQSFRGYADGSRNTKTGRLIVKGFQPKSRTDRTKDYINQIHKQLPVDFVLFTKQVHITKMHFVYPPLKKFHNIKGMMERLRAGEIVYKNTLPDLSDNLKKLVLDSMRGIVFKDDGLIVSEDGVKKYYGTGGMIIIEMQGF